MPRVNWKPVEELTPFARMIREGFMWQRTPPMSMTDFAEFAGVSRQAVFGWLNHRVQPKRDSVKAVSKATGLDLDDLLRAAGLPDSQMDAEARKRVSDDFAELMRLVDTELRGTGKSSAQRKAMREMLREIAPRFMEKAASLEGADDDSDNDSNSHRRRAPASARG